MLTMSALCEGFLYNGKFITRLLSWGGILFTSLVAFILPLALALYVVKRSTAPGSIAVYGRFSLNSTQNQVRALQALLVFAVISITIAIVGDIV